MILRLLALIVLPLLAYSMVRAIARRFTLDARQTRLLFFLVAILLVIAILVIMGRLPIHFILAPIGVAATFLLRMLPALLRLLPFWHMVKSRMASARPGSSPQTSTIRTAFLEVVLDHGSGEMDGEVLAGRFEKRQLSSLSAEELLQLHAEVSGDADSRQVLEAYLDRTQGEWRTGQEQQQTNSVTDESAMTRELALSILGLEPDADRDAIIRAHRSLMQKLHPDRGGNDYFATKINLAKDFLLDES